MTRQEQRIARRRAKARALRVEGLSTREIAERLGCSKSTIAADLLVVEPERRPVANLQDERGRPVAGAEAGNTRSLQHGVYSERRLAPVRADHARQLADRYPWIDPGRRATEAQRRAMIDLASSWLDEQGSVVRDDEGRVYDVADKLARWLGASEAWTERAERERREHRRFDVLAEVMAGDGDQDEGEDDGDAA